jgi:hypothetical protein
MKLFRNILALLAPLSLMPQLALAAVTTGLQSCSGTGLCNPLGYDSLTTFLQRLLQIVAQIGFPVIVLFLVYIGFQYIAAEGNPEKIKKVHSYFFWALVGSLIVLGAEALSLAIQATVNDLSTGL